MIPGASRRNRLRPVQPVQLQRSVARAAAIQWLLRAGECLFGVAALLILSGAVSPILHRFLGLTGADAEGDSLTRALLAPVYLISAAVVLIHFRSTINAVVRFPWAIALPLLALLSTYWSISPELTFRRSVAFCATTVVGLYFATRFDPAAFLKLLAWTLGLAAVGSLLVSLISPSTGVLSTGNYSGAWYGLFLTKNDLGRCMALAIVTLLVLRADRYAQRRLTLAGLAVAGALVLLSRSLTAAVTALLLVGLLRFYRMLNRSLGAATLTAIGFLLLTGIPAIWIASEADTILRAAGRDITLSGRTVLWGFVLESIRQQPWIGYGFSAFWTEANSAATFIITEIRWSTPHAHNGFLDLLLELGVVGLTIFLIGFGVALARAGRAVRTSEGLTALWPVAYLTFLFLYNLTESASVKQGSMYWVLYVATFCSATWTPYRLADRAERPRFRPGGVVSLGVRTRMRRKWVGDDRSWRQGSG